MPSKQSQSKAQPAQNNNNNNNSNNTNNTDSIKHLKEVKYWILEWAATHYLPHFIQALSEDESEGFKQFLASTDENVRNRVLLCLVPSMAASTRTDESLQGAIHAFRGSAPANHEKYGIMMANLKLYVFIDEIEAREIIRKTEALKLWKQLYEPADSEHDVTMNSLLVRELNSFDASSRKRIIDRLVEDFGLRHFIDRLEDFVKEVLKSDFDTPILDQIAKDVNKGDYFPFGTITASELRSAFEGTDQQWQNIFKQKDKNVKDFIQKLNDRPKPVPPQVQPMDEEPAPSTPHTTPKNPPVQRFSKSAAVSGQQRPLAIKVTKPPVTAPSPAEEPAPAPVVQPKAKQGKPRLDKQVTEKIRTLRDESQKLLAHGEDPLPRAIAESENVKKRRHSVAPTTAPRSRTPSPRPSPRSSQASQPKAQEKPKSAPSSTVKSAPEKPVQVKRKRSSEGQAQGTTVQWDSDEEFEPNEEEEHEFVLNSPQTLREFRVVSQQKRGLKHTGQRRRRRWTEQETLTLIRGIMEFGMGSWSVICKAFEFEDRTPVDLKDRYRTITSTDEKMAQFNSIVERLKAEKLEKRMKNKQKQLQKKKNGNNNADEDEDVDIEEVDEEQEDEVEDIEEDEEEEEQSLQHKKKKSQ